MMRINRKIKASDVLFIAADRKCHPKGLAKKARKEYWTFGTINDKQDRVIGMDGEIACLIGDLVDDRETR